MRAKVHFTTDEILIPHAKKFAQLQLLPETKEEAEVIEKLFNILKDSKKSVFHLHAEGRQQASITLSVSPH